MMNDLGGAPLKGTGKDFMRSRFADWQLVHLESGLESPKVQAAWDPDGRWSSRRLIAFASAS